MTLAANVNAQLAEGGPTSLSFRPISIEPLIAAWLEHLEHVRRLAVTTVNRYRTSIEHLKRFVASVHLACGQICSMGTWPSSTSAT